MALTQEQQQEILDELTKKVGCPIGNQDKRDRLDCFGEGIRQAVIFLGGRVTLDTVYVTDPQTPPEAKQEASEE